MVASVLFSTVGVAYANDNFNGVATLFGSGKAKF